MSHFRLNSTMLASTLRTGKLDLHGRALYTFPNDLFQHRDICQTLTVLDVSGNKLKELPNEIGLLTNLKELYVEGNDLKSLPASLVNTQLKAICLGDNPSLDSDLVRLYHMAAPLWRSRAREANSIVQYLASKASRDAPVSQAANDAQSYVPSGIGSSGAQESYSRPRSQAQQLQLKAPAALNVEDDGLDARTRARLAAQEYEVHRQSQSQSHESHYDQFSPPSQPPQHHQQQQQQQHGGFEYDDRSLPVSPQQYEQHNAYSAQAYPSQAAYDHYVPSQYDAPVEQQQQQRSRVSSSHGSAQQQQQQQPQAPTGQNTFDYQQAAVSHAYFPIGGRRPVSQNFSPFARDDSLKMETRNTIRSSQLPPRPVPLPVAGSPSAIANSPQFGRRANRPRSFNGVVPPFGTESDTNQRPASNSQFAPVKVDTPFGTDLTSNAPPPRKLNDPNTVVRSSLQSTPFAMEDQAPSRVSAPRRGVAHVHGSGAASANTSPFGITPNSNQYTTASKQAAEHVVLAQKIRSESEVLRGGSQQGGDVSAAPSSSYNTGGRPYEFRSPFAREGDGPSQQTPQARTGVARSNHSSQQTKLW